MLPAASAAAVPGPMAATRAAPKARASRHGGEQPRGAVGRGDDDPVVGRRAASAAAAQGGAAVGGRRRSRSRAPRSARRPAPAAPRASWEACWRVRVTTTRRPNSGRRSNQARSTAATSPTTITDGAASGCVGDRAERGPHGALLGPGAPAHGRHRGVGGQPAGHQLLGDPRDARHAHEDHDRAADPRHGPPVDRAVLARGRVLVAGDDGERRGAVAQRDRDAGVGGHGDGRRDAGHDLERHAGRRPARPPPRRRGRTRTGRRP